MKQLNYAWSLTTDHDETLLVSVVSSAVKSNDCTCETASFNCVVSGFTERLTSLDEVAFAGCCTSADNGLKHWNILLLAAAPLIFAVDFKAFAVSVEIQVSQTWGDCPSPR